MPQDNNNKIITIKAFDNVLREDREASDSRRQPSQNTIYALQNNVL